MNHKELEAWKQATKFVSEIYKITQKFPQHELYGLTNQIRRSAISIPANFLYISIGSIAELETELIIANDLHYIKNIDDIINQLTKIRSLILGLIKYLKHK